MMISFSSLVKSFSSLIKDSIQVRWTYVKQLMVLKYSESYIELTLKQHQCCHVILENSSGTETDGMTGMALAVKWDAGRVAGTDALY